MQPIVHIKENSLIAKIAAWKLHSATMAITIGHTIHLHHTLKADFLKNTSWLCHELKHVAQFQEHGFIRFIFKYLWESAKKGYHQNKFEIEARLAEGNPQILEQFKIH